MGVKKLEIQSFVFPNSKLPERATEKSVFEKVMKNLSLTKFLKNLTYQQGTLRLIILSTLIEYQ